MLSTVAALTLEFERGAVTAAEVVAALYRPQSPTHRTTLARVFRPSPDDQVADPPANTWDEVLRHWDVLSEAQQRELVAARAARFGKPCAPGRSAAGRSAPGRAAASGSAAGR